jgi:hypothetical protein
MDLYRMSLGSCNTCAFLSVSSYRCDRFLGLSRPECSYFVTRSIVLLIASVWIVMTAINLPLYFYTDVVIIDLPPAPITRICARLTHMDAKSTQIYQLASRIIVYFIPLGIMWFSYAGIYWKTILAGRKVRTCLDFCS